MLSLLGIVFSSVVLVNYRCSDLVLVIHTTGPLSMILGKYQRILFNQSHICEDLSVILSVYTEDTHFYIFLYIIITNNFYYFWNCFVVELWWSWSLNANRERWYSDAYRLQSVIIKLLRDIVDSGDPRHQAKSVIIKRHEPWTVNPEPWTVN